jgi:hypothetical protein
MSWGGGQRGGRSFTKDTPGVPQFGRTTNEIQRTNPQRGFQDGHSTSQSSNTFQTSDWKSPTSNPFADEFDDLKEPAVKKDNSSTSNETQNTADLLNALNKLSPEQRAALIANVKGEPDNSSQPSGGFSSKPKPKVERYMEEDKEPYYENNRHYRNEYQGRQDYKGNNTGNKGYSGYSGQGFQKASQGAYNEGYYEKKNYNDNQFVPKHPERKPDNFEDRRRNEEPYTPSIYRDINKPNEQVWKGPSGPTRNMQPSPAQNQNFNRRAAQRTDAIFDNMKVREDMKSIHTIFTKIKGERYIDSLPKDFEEIDPKIGSRTK